NDPRFDSLASYWVGPIYGQADSDPGDPRAGIYFLVGGTLAQVLVSSVFKGTDPVGPQWQRGAAAIQWEIGGRDKTGSVGWGFFQGFTLYGGAFQNAGLSKYEDALFGHPKAAPLSSVKDAPNAE